MICKREISLICAVTSDGYIGVDGDLCIKSPTDLAFFKEVTMGKTVIMGRETYDSLPNNLLGRNIIVITSSEDARYPNNFKSITDALYLAYHNDVVFIGGQRIFDEGVEYCDTVYMTVFDNECRDGDKVKLTFDEEYLKMYSFTKERLFLIDDIDKKENHITGQVFKFTRNWN
jgi:dihydrofolate reductase